MISIQNLSKGFEKENLFEDINLVIHLNERIAFVGKNGAGKTTFFNCLAGNEHFEGRILVSDIKISLMEQEQNFANLDKTFMEYLMDKELRHEERKTHLEREIGNPQIYEDEGKFNSLMDEYNLLLTDVSFDVQQVTTREILDKLGIDDTLMNQEISTLSGGQKTKLRLAECLSKRADLYLLDEPTNNLDIGTREWLEGYIKEKIISLIVISHDRYFLNRVASKVWDLENQTIKEWSYPFSLYSKKKKDYLAALQKRYESIKAKKEALLASAKEKREWARIKGSKTLRILADRLERDANNLEDVKNPHDFIKDIKINFGSLELHKCVVFRLEDVSKSFDKILFQGVNLNIEFGEKVCVLGKNGMGKSTFLKMLMGLIPPTGGKIIGRHDLSVGYFDQELSDIDRDCTVMDLLVKETGKDESKLIAPLVKYGFEKNVFHKKIKFLSGGEKGRLNLLRISLEKKNVLILDEPTNNLDIYLVESLEMALKDFGGTVVFVSHDRYFVDRVATRVLEIKDKKIHSFKGNYSEYIGVKK